MDMAIVIKAKGWYWELARSGGNWSFIQRNGIMIKK